MDQSRQKETEQKIQEWIDRLHLEAHPEGGWFSEVYAAPAEYGSSRDGRVMGGTIYFLLGKEDISHFHVIDCDEIWYFHEGCGVELWLLNPENKTAECRRLGCGKGEEKNRADDGSGTEMPCNHRTKRPKTDEGVRKRDGSEQAEGNRTENTGMD